MSGATPGPEGMPKGQLSGYEHGRLRPAVPSLDAILVALGCNLNDLHNALQVVNGRPGELTVDDDPVVIALRHLDAARAALSHAGEERAERMSRQRRSGQSSGVPMSARPTEEQRYAALVRRDLAWLSNLSDDTLRHLETSSPGQSRKQMIRSYLVNLHGLAAVRLADAEVGR